jgi:hypothetical protein
MSRFWASMLAYRHILAVFSFYCLGSYTVLIVLLSWKMITLPLIQVVNGSLIEYVYLNVYDLTPVLDNK